MPTIASSNVPTPKSWDEFEDITLAAAKLRWNSPDYAYMSRIEKVKERRDDLEFLMEQSPYLNIGTPDYLVERFRRIEEMGCNEIVMRIDGMPTELVKQAISLIGEEVIPKFRPPDRRA